MRDLTGCTNQFDPEMRSPSALGVYFCRPDLLLSAIVSMVDSTGLDQTRAWLRARKSMRGVGGHLFALHSWANGVADPTWFWRLARSARTSGSLFQELCAGQQQMDPALRAVFDPQSTSWDAVALDGPAPDGKSYGLVLAPSLGGVGSRLEFFRALEVLLLVDRNRTVLATPVWTDGTLDLDHLLARLRAAEGKPIGPLDLVQALHRLRNCDTARVEELDRLQATGGIWRTAPALTSPDGDESWNVLEVIRTWVGEGGLPPLDPIRGSDGLWTAQGKSPVPWSRCRAAPAELRDNRWSPSAGCDMVSDGRIFPLWPDRTLPAQEPREVHTIPARLPGSFGQPLHEAFLSMLAWGIEMRNRNAMAVARLTLRNAKVSTWHYQNAVRSRCEAGRLNVDDLACATEAMFEHGCLAQFWAPSLAAADTLCTLGNTPVSGLDRFLKVLAEYVPEVPEPVVPPGLRAFAAMPGTAKAHRAARALVEALETSEATP